MKNAAFFFKYLNLTRSLKNMKHIGKLEKIQHISYGYYQLAQIDEEVADNLLRIEKYRHSMYFYIQAMEKYIRARIFEINSNKHFR
jgi:hypothetical protein